MIEPAGRNGGGTGLIGLADRRVALSIFCLLLALYTATFDGPAASPDAEVSFQTTSALWRTGSLALGGTPEAEALIAHAERTPPGGFSVRAGTPRGDVQPYYGWYGVGQALVALPFYAVGSFLAEAAPTLERDHGVTRRYDSARSEYMEHLFVGWRSPVLGALTGMLVVLALLRLGLSRRLSFIAGLGYGCTSFAWPQALSDLSDVQATALVALGCYALLVLHQQPSRRAALVLGFSAGLAFLTRSGCAPLLLCLDVAFLLACRSAASSSGEEPAPVRARRRRMLLLSGLAPQLALVGVWLLLNQLRFGDPLDSGYGEALRGGLFGGDPLRATAGLLVSPGKGLLWMAPALLLLPSGVKRARALGQPGLVLFVALMFLGAFLPAAFTRGWHGAWTYGPRYLLPALPLLWVLAGLGFSRSDFDSRPRPALHALMAFGLLVQVPGMLVDSFTYHELAVVAAREHFPVSSELPEADQEAQRFDELQFDWGFAAPWAHWRILRHRVAGLGEDFPASELFRYPTSLRLSPAQERERGFGHLAWVDLSQRLGRVIWLPVTAILLLLGAGLVLAGRALDTA
jgi:hypothetical protein